MANPTAATIIRSKKLGALVRDARLAAGKSTRECAEVLNCSPETFESYETAQRSPSLPEIEALAYFLNIPVEHFWGNQSLQMDDSSKNPATMQRLIALRHKIIGAQLRKARLEAGLTLEELASKTGWSSEKLESYETGKAPIPLPELEQISSLLNQPLKQFLDRQGLVGAWTTRQQRVKRFLTLPDELQDFVSKPVNQPFLELAQRLNEMPVDKLRAIAEGLLEITL